MLPIASATTRPSRKPTSGMPPSATAKARPNRTLCRTPRPLSPSPMETASVSKPSDRTRAASLTAFEDKPIPALQAVQDHIGEGAGDLLGAIVTAGPVPVVQPIACRQDEKAGQPRIH